MRGNEAAVEKFILLYPPDQKQPTNRRLSDATLWMPKELAVRAFQYARISSSKLNFRIDAVLMNTFFRRRLADLQRIALHEDTWHYLKKLLKSFKKCGSRLVPPGTPV